MISVLGYSVVLDVDGRTQVGHTAESEPMNSKKKPKNAGKTK